MAKIILKCRYLKPGSAKHSLNTINYIAKRDGVDKIDDSRKHLPATREQKKLVDTLLNDFPELKNSFEYRDFLANPTKGNATEFIERAIEDNIDLAGKRKNYVGYIAMRPHVEKQGSHGLFTDDNVPIALSRVAKEVSEHEGNVWTNVVSIRREDAVRLGYDNGEAWRTLLRSNTAAMAESMKIPLEDLRWYAAFHNESYHPHVHIVAYSAGKEPYLSPQGIEMLKSALARDIFRQDLLQIYTEQTKRRDELKAEGRCTLENVVEAINHGVSHEHIATLLNELACELEKTSGKKVYGYLPKKVKNIVDSIVDELQRDSRIAELYELWYVQREKVLGIYNDELPQRIPLSQNREFKSVKNAVIRAAMELERESSAEQNDSSAPLHTDFPVSVIRLINHASNIILDKLNENSEQIIADSKERFEINAKKRAHGLHM